MPKIIWQTYSNTLLCPPESNYCRETWRFKNPDWQINFHDDLSVRLFICDFFPHLLHIFDRLPHGAMKADLWRYAILYQKGGLYADIDTICNSSLDDWLENRNRLHVACENNHPYFCQWAFASPPAHPVLRIVLELILQRFTEDDGIDTSMVGYIHHYTGPGVWTAAIQQYLSDSRTPLEIFAQPSRWEQREIILYPEGEFTWGKISHQNASLNWESTNYKSWQKERKDI